LGVGKLEIVVSIVTERLTLVFNTVAGLQAI
jgi:hypothetical protein